MNYRIKTDQERNRMIHKSAYQKSLFLLAVFLFFSLVSASSYADSFSKLDNGSVVNAKMKSLASNTELDCFAKTSDIKAIRMADSLPDHFVPSPENTVSTDDSPYPVYIFFDNANEAGIMYFFTESDKIVMNPYSHCMFTNNEGLTDISGIAGWDCSDVKVMYDMFGGASSLPDVLAIKNWDTSSVVDMSFLFSGATSLKFVDVSNWDTSHVVSMAGMFQVGQSYAGDGQLQLIIGLENLNVSNVTDMTCMFYGAGQMLYYDIGNWDVSKVESMNHMFCDNFKLRSLDLSRWDVSCVKTIHCMFDDNYELQTIGDVSHWNTVNLIDAGGWLNGARAFVGNNTGTMDLSGWDTSNLKAAGEMFRATQIRAIDLTGWIFDSITNDLWEGAGEGIFYETGNRVKDLRGLGEMFRHTKKLKVVYVSQAGLDSYHSAVERGVNTENMWFNSLISDFTVK